MFLASLLASFLLVVVVVIVTVDTCNPLFSTMIASRCWPLAGMGLERMAQILQEKPNNYETDLIFPIIEKAAALAGKDYLTSSDKEKQWFKVAGDHIRACVYLISDGVTPSNVGRGYIVRRLIRRVVRCTRQLGASTHSSGHILPLLAEVVQTLCISS